MMDIERIEKIDRQYREKFGEHVPTINLGPDDIEKIFLEAEKAVKGERGPITVYDLCPGYQSDWDL